MKYYLGSKYRANLVLNFSRDVVKTSIRTGLPIVMILSIVAAISTSISPSSLSLSPARQRTGGSRRSPLNQVVLRKRGRLREVQE